MCDARLCSQKEPRIQFPPADKTSRKMFCYRFHEDAGSTWAGCSARFCHEISGLLRQPESGGRSHPRSIGASFKELSPRAVDCIIVRMTPSLKKQIPISKRL